ncbi:MAG: DNA polymerase I, partial [Fretibacterium sp.]|nr:DNA polymerase I [Fretibacterium sp.]
MDAFLIVDGHALAFRAFYALPMLNAPDGVPTNAIAGFMNMLARVEEDAAPHRVVVAFDAPGPTFRHEKFAAYKAQRKPTPEDFKPQIPLLRELLLAMGYPVLSVEGVEADDVIASLALRAVKEGFEAVILSSDKDLMQILGDGVRMLRPVSRGVSNLTAYDSQVFEKEFGFPSSLVPDYLALLGDASDNVPGVPGVGEKTALSLISQWGSLERLYESLDELKPAVRKRLEAAKKDAFLSRELIVLRRDVPIDWEGCLKKEARLEEALALSMRLGLSRVAELIRKNMADSGGLEELVPEPERSLEQLAGGELLFIAPAPEGGFWLGDGEGASLYPTEGLSDLLARALRGRLVVEDYKLLISHLGPRALEGCSVWDLKTAHYLLHPDAPSHALSALAPEEGPIKGLRRLFASLSGELSRYEGLEALMMRVDLPLIPVLVGMERWGVRLEPEAFSALETELEARVAEIEREIAKRAGETINLNSPKQVAELLFERLGLPSGGKTKGGTSLSTSASVLEGLVDLNLPHSDVPRLILEHRELSKMSSGFVVPLQKAAKDGVIHTTFEAALTGTGRLSSRDPNLQNLPAFGHWATRIKEGLTPVRSGNLFVAADYSQVELRILAHFSGEERLIEAFHKGRDVHRETASWVFAVDADLVTPELRRVAKMINFGLLYGMSAFGLGERLGIDRVEAGRIVK